MTINLLLLEDTYIYEQLQIEEALLRTDDQNWCIINTGSKRAIVMGISAKAQNWIDLHKTKQDQIPLIKRFSGGGVVVVDENTFFVTFIGNADLLEKRLFPENIHLWAEKIYKGVFQMEGFRLQENDYVIGSKKFGGNAQYIRKDRWLHHTTFLWDYRCENMQYLLHPPKTPKYRKNRNHEDFLCRLKEFFPNKESVIKKLKKHLEKRFPYMKRFHEFSLSKENKPYRKTVKLLDI